MTIFLQIAFTIIKIVLSVESRDEFLFFSPNRDFAKLNDSVTISCRTKNYNPKDFIFKRNGNIMVFKCKSHLDLPLNVNCGYVGDWYYMNATIPIVSWPYRGEYECIVNKESIKIYLNVAVPPKVKMTVAQLLYDNNVSDKVHGVGTLNNPYNIRNLNVKSIDIMCSSNCSYPALSYIWDITTTKTKYKNPLAISSSSHDNTSCTGPATLGMVQPSSMVRINCLEQKLTGLQLVECKVVDHYREDYIGDRAYVFCPEGEFVTSSNRSRLISKNMQMKVTTGEMINIIVGCSIGVILLISGIIIICKHRSKDDLDHQFTMRQNSIDHSGYRV